MLIKVRDKCSCGSPTLLDEAIHIDDDGCQHYVGSGNFCPVCEGYPTVNYDEYLLEELGIRTKEVLDLF